MARVLRIFSTAAVLAVAAAGCGGAGRPQGSAFPGVPRSLAQEWEGQASAIAAAAATGDDCRALQLAKSLRGDVIAKEQTLPRRLRSPLRQGVSSLVDRITLADRVTCTPAGPKPPHTAKPPTEPKPGSKPKGLHHEPHGHHKHGGGNDQ